MLHECEIRSLNHFEKVFLRQYSNGLVYLRIKLKDQSITKSITFGGRHISEDDAFSRASKIAMGIVQRNMEMIEVSSEIKGKVKLE